VIDGGAGGADAGIYGLLMRGVMPPGMGDGELTYEQALALAERLTA
jgi:hypothetical protein